MEGTKFSVTARKFPLRDYWISMSGACGRFCASGGRARRKNNKGDGGSERAIKLSGPATKRRAQLRRKYLGGAPVANQMSAASVRAKQAVAADTAQKKTPAARAEGRFARQPAAADSPRPRLPALARAVKSLRAKISPKANYETRDGRPRPSLKSLWRTPCWALLIVALGLLLSAACQPLNVVTAQAYEPGGASAADGGASAQQPPATPPHQAESSPQASSAAGGGGGGAACFGGLQTFEKISMSSFENPGGNSAATGGSFGSGILIQQDDQALTSECINLCRSQPNCLSFVIDYNKFECKSYATTQQELQAEFAAKFQSARSAPPAPNQTTGDASAIDSPSGGGGGGYQTAASSSQANLQQLLPSASSNYFEKICLDGVANRNQFADVCGQNRLWTVERVVDSFLDGFVEKEVTNVNGKDECSKLCIFETQFVCRSADYDQQARLCRLSKEDRRTQPQAMRYVANSNRQYLESQCATPGPSSCVYETKRNVGIISMDALKFAQTVQDCQMKCNQEATFNCRSYSFHQQRCFLSGDDSASLNSNLVKLPLKQGWTFGEKRCLVELCTKGLFSYEKITGFTLRSALSTSIDLMVPASSSHLGALSNGGPDGLHSQESSQGAVVRLRQHLLQSAAAAYNSSSLASAMMTLMSGGGAGGADQIVQQAASGDPMHESASSARQTRSSASNLAITGHCRHSCDLGYLNCPAFTIDYKNNRCQRLDRNSQGRHHELVARDGFAYYEKICLRAPEIMSMCQDKFWIFERVIGYELAPRLYERSLKFVQSRRDCEEYCLEERQFQCRSALYNDETSDCKLSRYDRRLALQEGAYYRNFNARLSYLENNCLRDHQLEKREHCYYEQARDEPAYPTFTERIEMAAAAPASEPPSPPSAGGGANYPDFPGHHHGVNGSSHRFGAGFCEQLCNENAKFECHSFGYYASTAQCFLSADDSVSAGELASTPSTGFTYYEKKCRLAAAASNATSAPPAPPPPAGLPAADEGDSRAGIGTIISSSTPSSAPQNPYLPPPTNHDAAHSMPVDGDQAGANSTVYSNPNPMRPFGGGGGSMTGPRKAAANTTSSPATPQGAAGLEPDLYKCGVGHSYVYQRISGFEPIGGYLTLLVRNNEQPGIVAECADLCKRAYECRAFVVDYNNNQCFAMLENSAAGLLSLRQALGKDYFEGFCLANQLLLAGPSAHSSISSGGGCRNKTWLVDKIVDQAVVGVQHARLLQDSDRFQCRQACFEERLFWCKSAMFDSATGDCKLYSIDRESVAQMRLVFTKGVDFFENQCQISSAACPYDAIERDMTIITATKSLQARSTFDCELACNTEPAFNCRSYTYLDQYPSLPNLCLLSSDSRSTSQRGSVARHQRTLYAERNCYYRKPRYPGGGGGGGGAPSQGHRYEPAPAQGGYSGGPAAGPSPALNSLADAFNKPAHNQPDFAPDSLGPHAHGGLEDKFAPIAPPPPPLPPHGNTELEDAPGANPYEPALGAPGCEPHQFTFERTFGYELRLAPRERAPIAPTIGIAIGCQQECLKRGERCQSFVVEYALPYQSCFLLEGQAGANKRLLARAFNSAYFEKVCLPRAGLEPPTGPLEPLTHAPLTHAPPPSAGQPLDAALDISPSYSPEPWSPQLTAPLAPAPPPPNANQLPYYLQQQQLVQSYPSRACSKLWSFERFLNHNFTAPAERVLENSLSRAHCETQCLNEAGFSCRAATYDYANKLCRLFKSTRRTILSQLVDLEAPHTELGAAAPATGGAHLPDSHPGTAHVISGEAAQGAESIQSAASASPNNSAAGGAQQQQQQQQQQQRPATSGRQLTAAPQPPQPAGQTGEPTRPGRNIDYLENACTPEPSSCQYRQIYDQFSPYIDRVQHAVSLGDCQRQCDQERLFGCKAVNYDPVSRNCMLVNEDLLALNRGQQQSLALLPKRNTIYSEKGNCEMISVQCNSQEMLVSINFDAPFRGRVMAKGNPEQCHLLGDGQTSLQFSIVFGPKCNSRQEGHNTFVNEVVIQQHPVIMTESDKTVRVMCAFEAPEQTITLKSPMSRDGGNKTGIDVGAPSEAGRTRNDKQQFNSVVSNKAAPPSVLLRILDLQGRDATMINLGDDLTLRIQMQMDGLKNSALGIFARNLAARSSNGESLLLIDNDGCPVDPQVFPALEIDPKDGKSLVSTFKAFRFPSSGLVNFEVQIRFCPERCQPVDCQRSGQRARSFGKRRRRRQASGGGAAGAADEAEAAAAAAADDDARRPVLAIEPRRAPILQSLSEEAAAAAAALQAAPGQQSAGSPLDSLSTVMKPGKAFEYVRKLMLPQAEAPPLGEPEQPAQHQQAAGSDANQDAPASSSAGAGAVDNQAASATATQGPPVNEEFDNPAAGLGGAETSPANEASPSDDGSMLASGQQQQQQPQQQQQQPSLVTAAQKAILMHVDEKVVPASDFAAVARATSHHHQHHHHNHHPQTLAPYGRFPSATVEEPAPAREVGGPELASGAANDFGQASGGQFIGGGAPTSTGDQRELPGALAEAHESAGGARPPMATNSAASEDDSQGGETTAATLSSGFHPIEPPRRVQSSSLASLSSSSSSPGNREMPLRFSILVGENQAGAASGRPAPGQPSVLIMNSTSMDLDHIVIAGKKGQLELDGDPGQTIASSLGAPHFAAAAAVASNFNGDGAGGRHRHAGEAPSKRNASYEQTFDALPSNSISSELHPVDRLPAAHKPARNAGAESAASHDCQLEAGRSRLRTIIWTGGIVIALNICLVILSLVLYFRKVHLRQHHSIVSSSSDCGTHRLSRARALTSGGGGGDGDESGRWPSVILKSKNKLGATSLNAHEHFFCKLNGSRQTSGAAGLEHEFNWPNLSSSTSRSTISSLASPVPSTSIRVNQLRPSLKSAPFDAHSTLRSGNFKTNSMLDDPDHRDEFNARYTNNIDILHSDRF